MSELLPAIITAIIAFLGILVQTLIFLYVKNLDIRRDKKQYYIHFYIGLYALINELSVVSGLVNCDIVTLINVTLKDEDSAPNWAKEKCKKCLLEIREVYKNYGSENMPDNLETLTKSLFTYIVEIESYMNIPLSEKDKITIRNEFKNFGELKNTIEKYNK
jgi:hypothetical protein